VTVRQTFAPGQPGKQLNGDPMPNREIVAQELGKVFAALAHPERIRIVEELRDCERDVHSLQQTLGVRQPRISQHLATLKSRQLVQERRQGRRVLYRLTQPALAAWILGALPFIEPDPREIQRKRSAVEEVRLLWSSERDRQQEVVSSDE
jgi:DNA-binding transcriptional ArsR family regulator